MPHVRAVQFLTFGLSLRRLPPLQLSAQVAISRDACDTTLLLNVLLTLLAWLPGWLHATWVVASRSDPEAPWGYGPLTRPPV